MRVTGKIQMGGSVRSQAPRDCSITIIPFTQEVGLWASRHVWDRAAEGGGGLADPFGGMD